MISDDVSSIKLVIPLPSAYASGQPTALRSKDFTAPAVDGHVRPSNQSVVEIRK